MKFVELQIHTNCLYHYIFSYSASHTFLFGPN